MDNNNMNNNPYAYNPPVQEDVNPYAQENVSAQEVAQEMVQAPVEEAVQRQIEEPAEEPVQEPAEEPVNPYTQFTAPGVAPTPVQPQYSYTQEAPVKNNFVMRLIFAIVEILTIFACNLVTFGTGIGALITNLNANKAFKNGDMEKFKKSKKISNILLFVGLGVTVLSFIIGIIALIAVAVAGPGIAKSFEDVLPSELREELNLDDDYDDDYDYDWDDDDDYSWDDDDDYSWDDDASETTTAASSNYIVTNYDGYTEKALSSVPNWNTITINNAVITLPTTVETIQNAGFTIESTLATETLDTSYYNSYSLYYDDSYVGLVYVGNFTEGTINAVDGVVYRLILHEIDGAAVTFANGLTFDSTEYDVLNEFGYPGYLYTSDTSEDYYAEYLEWYYDGDSAGNIEVDFWDNEIDTIYVEYRGGL